MRRRRRRSAAAHRRLPYQLKWTKAVIQDLLFDVSPGVWLPASRMSGNQIVYSDMEIIQTVRAGVHVLETHYIPSYTLP